MFPKWLCYHKSHIKIPYKSHIDPISIPAKPRHDLPGSRLLWSAPRHRPNLRSGWKKRPWKIRFYGKSGEKIRVCVALQEAICIYIYMYIHDLYDMCITYYSIWFSGIYWGLFQKLGDSKHVVPPIYCHFNGGNRMKNNQNWGVPKIFQTNPSLASGKPTGKVLKEKEVKSILPLHKFECIQMTGRSPTKMGRQNVGWNQQKGDATSKQSAASGWGHRAACTKSSASLERDGLIYWSSDVSR